MVSSCIWKVEASCFRQPKVLFDDCYKIYGKAPIGQLKYVCLAYFRKVKTAEYVKLRFGRNAIVEPVDEYCELPDEGFLFDVRNRRESADKLEPDIGDAIVVSSKKRGVDIEEVVSDEVAAAWKRFRVAVDIIFECYGRRKLLKPDEVLNGDLIVSTMKGVIDGISFCRDLSGVSK